MKITDIDKLECVERELRMRHRTYSRLVRGNRMSVELATRETAVMSAIVNDYREKVHGRANTGREGATGAGAEGAALRTDAGGSEGGGEDRAYGSDASGTTKAAQAG